MSVASRSSEFPLVGRAEELALLRSVRAAAMSRSAVVSGPAGVGKSRLASAAASDAAADGWATVAIRGSAGLSGVPLGSLRTVLGITGPNELAELTAAVEGALLGLRSRKGLVVLADDCQQFDDATAGLLHQLVAGGSIVVIATARSGTQLPQAIVDLWKDGLAERLELQNLSRLETTQLLTRFLGGNVQDSSANRMWHVTAGNPLYLREVVLASMETGALAEIDGEWRWRGAWATGARLHEIVASRLSRLDADEVSAMELLAVAGTLPAELVARLTTHRAIDGLEQHGLVTTEQSRRRIDVSIAHPLHAEVIREQMPVLQQRAVRRNLIDTVNYFGARRASDRVRIACWSLESGVDVDPVTLTQGANAALFVIGQAIASRIREVLPDVTVHPPSSDPVITQDAGLAVRLARSVYESNPGMAEAAALASALGWVKDAEGAEAVLAEVSLRATSVDDQLRLALAIGWIRFWSRADPVGATAGLEGALAKAGTDGDPLLTAEIHQELAGIALNTAHPALALEQARLSAVAEGTRLAEGSGAAPAAAALAYLGRCSESLALIDEALPLAVESGHPLMAATLMFTRAGTLARLGKLDEALSVAEWLRDVALSRDHLEATANFGIILGEILLRQGRPRSAGRMLRDASGLLSEQDVLGYRPWALASLSRARARVGDLDGATAALEEARARRTIARHYEWAFYLAEIELHTIAGRRDDAIASASKGAGFLREAGMVVDEAVMLDAWLRVDPTPELARELEEAARQTDSGLVATLADHAAGYVADDPDRLLAVAERFAAMPARWYGAEAAAAAAALYKARRDPKNAKAAERLASALIAECEGSRSSVAVDLPGPVQLTKREREIATLAAKGRSSKEIAEGMYLSHRTVESHLYRVYTKLGVSDRSGLAAAMGVADS